MDLQQLELEEQIPFPYKLPINVTFYYASEIQQFW